MALRNEPNLRLKIPHTKASPRIRRRACLGKPRSIHSWAWWSVESKLVEHVLVGKIKMDMEWRSPRVFKLREVRTQAKNRFFKMVTEWWFLFLVVGVSLPRSSNHRVCDRLHSLSAHIRTFHACAHTRMAHGREIFAVPARLLRHHVSVRILAELSRAKSAGQAHFRTSTEEFGHLAKSGFEPNKFDKITVDDPYLENISKFSRVAQESNGLTCITTMCGPISALQVSCGDFDLSNERMPRETVRRQREKQRKEKVLWSVLQSRCQRKVYGTVLGVILFRLTENSILMNEISQKTWNEELNKLFLVKIQCREIYTRLRTTWRSQIWSEEIQNVHWSRRDESLNLKDDNHWKPINGQIKLNEREYICAANWRWRTIFIKSYARSCRKIEELNRRCYQEEILKNNKDWKNFLRSMIRNHEDWVHWEIKYEDYKNDWNILQTQNLLWSWQRIWVFLETFLIVNMLDEILMNYTMIQEIWRHHLRFWERKELRKVGAKNHCSQCLYLAFQWEQGEKV